MVRAEELGWLEREATAWDDSGLMRALEKARDDMSEGPVLSISTGVAVAEKLQPAMEEQHVFP